MAKIININGPLREPGQLTHNGKRYRTATAEKSARSKAIQAAVKAL